MPEETKPAEAPRTDADAAGEGDGADGGGEGGGDGRGGGNSGDGGDGMDEAEQADGRGPTAPVESTGTGGSAGSAGGDPEARLRRMGQRVAGLAERLDPDSFAVLLKVLSGLNTAFARPGGPVDVPLAPEERALLTPQLRREIAGLLEDAGHRVALGGVPCPEQEERQGQEHEESEAEEGQEEEPERTGGEDVGGKGADGTLAPLRLLPLRRDAGAARVH